jgi:hypothetical protein
MAESPRQDAMNHTIDTISSRWRLSPRDRARFAQACAVDDERLVEACEDIDRALGWLLSDPQAIRDWLRRPHPALYHETPLAIIFGDTSGRQRLRAALVEEAAVVGDPAARTARGAHQ